MTTYILAGGNDRKYDDFPERLNEEIHRKIAKPRILSCFFSQPPETWQERYDDWSAWFSKLITGIGHYELAQQVNFRDQVNHCDVIYLHGGDTKLLQEKLQEVGVDRTIFKGKIVIGSSAGANCLSRNYWSSTRAEAWMGLGLVDRNVMVHYGASDLAGRQRSDEDWEKEEAKFQSVIGSGERITRLPEAQFIVIES